MLSSTVTIPVSSLYAGFGARSAGDDVQHDDRVGRHVEHDADAVELSFDRLVGLSEVLRAEIHRMRVEIFENQRDDFFRERVHPHRVDILRVDQAEQHVELIGPATESAALRAGRSAPLRSRELPSNIPAASEQAITVGSRIVNLLFLYMSF